jgi:hypothetical protein
MRTLLCSWLAALALGTAGISGSRPAAAESAAALADYYPYDYVTPYYPGPGPYYVYPGPYYAYPGPYYTYPAPAPGWWAEGWHHGWHREHRHEHHERDGGGRHGGGMLPR